MHSSFNGCVFDLIPKRTTRNGPVVVLIPSRQVLTADGRVPPVDRWAPIGDDDGMEVRLEVKKARKGGALFTQANTCSQASLMRHDPRDAPRARC